MLKLKLASACWFLAIANIAISDEDILPPGWVISLYCAKILQVNGAQCVPPADRVCSPLANGTCSIGYQGWGSWMGDTIRGTTNFPVPEAGKEATSYGPRICYVETRCAYYAPYGGPGSCIDPQEIYMGQPNFGVLGLDDCFYGNP